MSRSKQLPPNKNAGLGFAVASIVTALLSLTIGFGVSHPPSGCPGGSGCFAAYFVMRLLIFPQIVLLGMVAIFGINAMTKITEAKTKNKKVFWLAVLGLILGIISLALFIYGLVISPIL